MMKELAVSSILSQSANCYYVVLDDHQKIVEYNATFQKLFTARSIANQEFTKLIPEHLHKHWRLIIQRLIKGDLAVEKFIASFDPSLIIHWELAIDDRSFIHMLGTAVSGNGNDVNVQLKGLVNELEKIMASSLDMICTLDEDGRFLTLSEASKFILGYSPRELLNQYFLSKVHPDDAARTIRAAEKVKQGFDSKNLENRFFHRDGHTVPIIWSMKWDEKDRRYYGVGRDVTEKKRAEQVLQDSEEKYKLLFYRNPLPMWIYDMETFYFLEVNEAAMSNYGYTHEEFLGMTIFDIRSTEEKLRLQNFYESKTAADPTHRGYWSHKRKDGSVILAEITAHLIQYEGKKAKLVLAADRTQQLLAEQEIVRTNERYSYVSKATFHVIWDWDLILDEIEWNNVVYSMFGCKKEEINEKNWWQNKLHDDDKDRVLQKLAEHIENRSYHWEDEYRFKCADGSYKYIFDRGFTIYDEHQQPLRMIGAMQDVTDLRANELQLIELNTSLEKRANELAESNAELERFAYVASHDLQEPLRMVSSFLQLIEKKYKDKLDQKGHEYIAFAVDGAERMKGLILDLLEYSRVNTSKEEKEDVDLSALLENLQLVYKSKLLETDGVIISDQLPVVRGSKTQLMQLFQNLVGNALKYKSDQPPVVKIRCIEEGGFYKFEVEDNGIGIDARYFQKIFIIFQRLHNREQYTGTGIGLAICKKIVERHGGKIWLTSTVGKGSIFYFTLSK